MSPEAPPLQTPPHPGGPSFRGRESCVTQDGLTFRHPPRFPSLWLCCFFFTPATHQLSSPATHRLEMRHFLSVNAYVFLFNFFVFFFALRRAENRCVSRTQRRGELVVRLICIALGSSQTVCLSARKNIHVFFFSFLFSFFPETHRTKRADVPKEPDLKITRCSQVPAEEAK